MDILYKSDFARTPEVSFILLDWSCRESFHMFHYLDRQSIQRDRYEVIWIEYYNRRSPELAEILKECEQAGRPPSIDQWIVLDTPQNVYYHKHLMYNVGIVASRGGIVVICDSDVMVRSTFVESIINAFDKTKNPNYDPRRGMILHLDEVRSVSKKYYPFNHPSFEDIESHECLNWENNTTTGLLEKEDPLHFLNYGACMCALREDLIAIGGADEHRDYLGHVCGPYEMTFRLANTGRLEVWHPSEYLYHTWHPGTDGYNNFIGPNDGKNISTTALEVKKNGRIEPLLENPAIRALRQNTKIAQDALLALAAHNEAVRNWTINETQMLISLGKSAFNRTDYDTALKCWNKVLTQLPKDGIAQCDVGWAHYFKANYDGAVKAFDEAIKLKPDNHNAYRGRGWTRLQEKRYDDAVRDFDDALRSIPTEKKDPLQGVLLSEVGWAYYLKSSYREALRSFDEALKLNPRNPRALCGRGWTLCQRDLFDEAIQNFNSALDYTRQDEGERLQEILRGRGWAEYGRRCFVEAIEDFNKALAYTASNSTNALKNIYCGIGWSLARMGRTNEAISTIKKGKGFLPGNSYMAKCYITARIFASNAKRSLKKMFIELKFSVF